MFRFILLQKGKCYDLLSLLTHFAYYVYRWVIAELLLVLPFAQVLGLFIFVFLLIFSFLYSFTQPQTLSDSSVLLLIQQALRPEQYLNAIVLATISIESHSVLVMTSLWEYFNLLEGVLLLKDQVIAIKSRDWNITKWFNPTLFREHLSYRTVNIASSSNTPDKFVRTPYRVSDAERKQRRQHAKKERRLSKTQENPFTTEIQRQDSQSSDVYPIKEDIETNQDSNMSGSGTPQPPQPTHQVIITQEQLEQLFERAVANEATQWANQGTMKDLKLVEQKPFNGKPNKLEDFITECELILNVKPNIYRQDNQYALQLMTQEIAAPWKSTYILQGHAERDMWDLFKDHLRESFQDVGRTDDALKWLATAKQSPHDTVDKFNTEFWTQAHRAGLALTHSIPLTIDNWRVMVPNVNQTMLQHMYQTAIRPKLASQILLTATHTSIED